MLFTHCPQAQQPTRSALDHTIMTLFMQSHLPPSLLPATVSGSILETMKCQIISNFYYFLKRKNQDKNQIGRMMMFKDGILNRTWQVQMCEYNNIQIEKLHNCSIFNSAIINR